MFLQWTVEGKERLTTSQLQREAFIFFCRSLRSHYVIGFLGLVVLAMQHILGVATYQNSRLSGTCFFTLYTNDKSNLPY